MRLSSCPDCGHEVSKSAPACPNCGRPGRGAKKSSVAAGVFGGLFLFFIVMPIVLIGASTTMFVDAFDAAPRPSSRRPSPFPSPTANTGETKKQIAARAAATPVPASPAVPQPPKGRDYSVRVVSQAPGSAKTVRFLKHGYGDPREAPLGAIAKGKQLTARGWKCAGPSRSVTPYFQVAYNGRTGFVNARNTEQGNVGLLDRADCGTWFRQEFPGLRKVL